MQFRNIPAPTCIALGVHQAEVPPDGLDPQAVLAELLGARTGPTAWLDVLARMLDLARAQATTSELVAALATGAVEGVELSRPLADAVVAACQDVVELAREGGRAELRERLWKAGLSGGAKGEAAIISLAKQYLGWDQIDGLDPKILRAAVAEAKRAKGVRGA